MKVGSEAKSGTGYNVLPIFENVGAKYPATFVDANGDFLQGQNSYHVHPTDIPGTTATDRR